MKTFFTANVNTSSFSRKNTIVAADGYPLARVTDSTPPTTSALIADVSKCNKCNGHKGPNNYQIMKCP